jgi:acyl carrier protein
MPDDVTRRVIRVISETQKIPIDTISPDSTFEELKIDSLDGINILFGIENEFNINVPDESVKELRSVREMAQGIEKLINGEAA